MVEPFAHTNTHTHIKDAIKIISTIANYIVIPFS